VNGNTGHGHVFPRPDGLRARCGGPGICPDCARDLVRKQEREGQPWPTGMRLHDGENWTVACDVKEDPDLPGDAPLRYVPATYVYKAGTGQKMPAVTLRQIGWLDQKGRVWLSMPPDLSVFDGGSLTPLLIDARED
jgi:hypothetical protein